MMQIEVQDDALQKLLKQVDKALSTGRAVFKEFALYMRQVTDTTFIQNRHGGSYRGVSWDYFAPQYTRKTDGVTVPAWGGVPKIKAGYSKYTKAGKERKKGLGKTGGKNVLGRRRPSGARIQKGDSVMQDSGALRARAALTLALGENKIELGPQGVSYAGEQQALRPFLFFEVPKDSTRLLRIALKHLQGEVSS